MDKKLQIKKEEKRVSEIIKVALVNTGIPISKITISDIPITSAFISERRVSEILEKQRSVIYNREFGKFKTRLCKCKYSLGVNAFALQLNEIKENKCRSITNLFDHTEIILAFNQVLSGE